MQSGRKRKSRMGQTGSGDCDTGQPLRAASLGSLPSLLVPGFYRLFFSDLCPCSQ